MCLYTPAMIIPFFRSVRTQTEDSFFIRSARSVQNNKFLPVFRFYASPPRTSLLQGNATTGARWAKNSIPFLRLQVAEPLFINLIERNSPQRSEDYKRKRGCKPLRTTDRSFSNSISAFPWSVPPQTIPDYFLFHSVRTQTEDKDQLYCPSKELEVLNYKITQAKLSDHFPIRSDFEICAISFPRSVSPQTAPDHPFSVCEDTDRG